MDAYQVNRRVFNFAASTVDVPLKARDIREVEFVSVPLRMLQYLEQDWHILTMVGSFLDCSEATSTCLEPRGGKSR